ncbi:hypothetical protein KBF61_00820 [Candidatus Saccharibacteria bacterium]|nr:hypothetical protein [Candidatus Saccharibacteria bacterium]
MIDHAETADFVDGPGNTGPDELGRIQKAVHGLRDGSGLFPDLTTFDLSCELPEAEKLAPSETIRVVTKAINEEYLIYDSHEEYLKEITNIVHGKESGVSVMRAGNPESKMRLLWFNGTGMGLGGQSAIMAHYSS